MFPHLVIEAQLIQQERPRQAQQHQFSREPGNGLWPHPQIGRGSRDLAAFRWAVHLAAFRRIARVGRASQPYIEKLPIVRQRPQIGPSASFSSSAPAPAEPTQGQY
jgi:hypothetical protein